LSLVLLPLKVPKRRPKWQRRRPTHVLPLLLPLNPF
jgi:hypothetical protein